MTIKAEKSNIVVEQAPEVAGGGRAASTGNVRVAVISASVAVFMLGMAYAAVPLYQMFCQVTGFAGTTQRAEKAPDQSEVLDQTITVRFDSNVANGLTWKFKPVQNTLDVKYGENRLAFYTATNTSDKPVTGTASFNVAPEAAGAYFNKIECFCFTEQTLQPGETVEMPVSFFVDPEMVKDRSARSITQVTLSYTFFPVTEEKRADVSVGKNSLTQ
jgi:cytochrome c oxidase assembly protein subunit 11